jgi:gamma-glutamyltranspeptidase/glutathione hydrolase
LHSIDRRAVLGAAAAIQFAVLAHASWSSQTFMKTAFKWTRDSAIYDEPNGPPEAGVRPAGVGPNWVAATEHPLAVAAASDVLKAGGTAADAIVAGVTVHNVVCAGTSTLAGTMSGVYHDAPSGKTAFFNAGCNLPLAEKEPWDQLKTTDTGRNVLVPGVVAGLGALSERYGRFAWKDLLRPAVSVAREGFLIYPQFSAVTQRYKEKLLRHESGREVMLVDGDLPKLGSRYRQPILAETLEALGEIGWTYFYGGRWGRNLVEALQQIDGRMAIEDLEHYEVRWDEPLRGNYLGYDIVANAPPQIGGSILIAGLNVADGRRATPAPKHSTTR